MIPDLAVNAGGDGHVAAEVEAGALHHPDLPLPAAQAHQHRPLTLKRNNKVKSHPTDHELDKIDIDKLKDMWGSPTHT